MSTHLLRLLRVLDACPYFVSIGAVACVALGVSRPLAGNVTACAGGEGGGCCIPARSESCHLMSS